MTNPTNEQLQEAVRELRKVLASCLNDLWYELHSGASEEQFNDDFSEEIGVLTKHKHLLGDD